MFQKLYGKTVDPDQTAPICFGSMLFASILNWSVMLGNSLQQTTSADNISDAFFSGASRVNDNCRLLSYLLIYFGSLYCRQYEPRSDTSLRSSLIGAHSVCFHEKWYSEVHLNKGAQWLSSRVLDSRLRVHASPASLCCVLEQDTFILA